jgi:all-beta uncharacterized protein
VAVTATAGCAWTASSNAPWITVTAGAGGSGNGSVSYAAAVNTGAARSGTITIAGRTFTLSQAARECTFDVSSTAVNVAAAGGASTVDVISPGGCAWTAAANATWLHITGGAAGTGNGTVTFAADANTTGLPRAGTLTIAGRTVTVSQAADQPPTCTFTISPTTQAASASTGAVVVSVTASAPSCAWTASSAFSWLTVDRASGTGTGSVTVTWADNTATAARSGAATIAGQTLTVNQAAAAPPCTFSISPTSQNVAETGGTGSVAVTASAATCAWTAASGAAWITIDRAGGTGSGAVGVTVAANTGGARTGTVTIAGQTFTVTQAASPPPCTFSIAPTSVTVDAGATTGSISVTASAGTCSWTAVSNVPWLTVTSGDSGQGSGTVAYAVAANGGGDRRGTITVAGRDFTVSQKKN